MLRLVAAAAALSVAGVAVAGSTSYNSVGSFLDNVQMGYYLNDFEGVVAAGSSLDVGVSAPFGPVNGFSYNITVDNPSNSLLYWGQGVFGSPLSTTTFGVNGPNDDVIINFTGANVTAFGGNIFITDQFFGPVTGTMTVTLSDGSNVVLNNPYQTSFVGFTSDTAISSVTISATGPGNTYITMDNLYVGVAVPAPGAAAVLGLAGVAGLRRRR
jgi:hypothetical protein